MIINWINFLPILYLLAFCGIAVFLHYTVRKKLEKSSTRLDELRKVRTSQVQEISQGQAVIHAQEGEHKPKESAVSRGSEISVQVQVPAETIPEPEIKVPEDYSRDDIRKLIAQLTQDELRILQFLVERGGESYQMEIYRTLNLPKSTVTKIVHRLSERGLLVVERKGRYNYVKLKNVELVKQLVNEVAQRS